MKILAIALLAVLLGACSYSERRHVRDDGYYGSGQVSGQGASGQDRHLICHKGKKTMELPASAVDAHLGHGDRRGPC